MAKKGTYEGKTLDLKVHSISKVESQGEKTDKTVYKLVAKDKDGTESLTLTSIHPFKGLNARDGVIMVSIENSQLTIDDFMKKDGEEGKE